MSINVCTFSGRLGRDSEVKYIPSGTAVLEFSLAVDTGFGDKKSSFWLKCAMFGDRGQKLSQYLLKGQQVIVSGEFSTREYQAGDGTTKISLELRVNAVELVGGKQDGGQRDVQVAAQQRQQPPTATGSGTKPKINAFDDMDDEIPFIYSIFDVYDKMGRPKHLLRSSRGKNLQRMPSHENDC
jgi:single-strand DNA-binding protein